MLLRAALCLLAVAALAGCGGHDAAPVAPAATTGATSTTTSAAATPKRLPASEIRRQLAASFTSGLRELATMTQTGDDPVALGQPLPTGHVDAVACRPQASADGGAAPWHCRVRWHDAADHARSTGYLVRIPASGCLTAGASPPLAGVRDATTRNVAEHPLNALAGSSRSC